MEKSQNLLVITASNGENLNLAKRFVEKGNSIGCITNLLDLTTIPLPLFNPRNLEKESNSPIATRLKSQMLSSSHWVICAPEYNGSIPPVFSNALAWLSIQDDDFRQLFNGRPIAMATCSGGEGMELLIALRIQLTHLGAQVVGRQVTSNKNKPAKEESITDLVNRLLQMKHLTI